MSGSLHFTVTTPFATLVDAPDVRSVRAEDGSGGFGVLPGHAPLLTVLPPSIVRWRGSDGRKRYCAIDGGVFTANAQGVRIACRDGLCGDDLDALVNDVSRMREEAREAGRRQRVDQVRLETQAMRRLLSVLQGGGGVEDSPFAPGDFR